MASPSPFVPPNSVPKILSPIARSFISPSISWTGHRRRGFFELSLSSLIHIFCAALTTPFRGATFQHGKGITLAQYFKTALNGGRGCKSIQFPALPLMPQRTVTTDSLIAWETPQLGIATHTNLLLFIQRLGSGCRRKCPSAEGAEEGVKLPWNYVQLLSLQSLVAMQKEKRTEAHDFQGSHMVPTDEAVWDCFCSLSV